jgi:hypothetical protein
MAQSNADKVRITEQAVPPPDQEQQAQERLHEQGRPKERPAQNPTPEKKGDNQSGPRR